MNKYTPRNTILALAASLAIGAANAATIVPVKADAGLSLTSTTTNYGSNNTFNLTDGQTSILASFDLTAFAGQTITGSTLLLIPATGSPAYLADSDFRVSAVADVLEGTGESTITQVDFGTWPLGQLATVLNSLVQAEVGGILTLQITAAPGVNRNIKMDDHPQEHIALSLTAVPEPSIPVLAGVAGLSLIVLRKRRI